MCWAGFQYFDCEAEFRFHWKVTKFTEDEIFGSSENLTYCRHHELNSFQYRFIGSALTVIDAAH